MAQVSSPVEGGAHCRPTRHLLQNQHLIDPTRPQESFRRMLQGRYILPTGRTSASLSLAPRTQGSDQGLHQGIMGIGVRLGQRGPCSFQPRRPSPPQHRPGSAGLSCQRCIVPCRPGTSSIFCPHCWSSAKLPETMCKIVLLRGGSFGAGMWS